MTISGMFTPIVTPFRHDGTVDEPGLRANVAHWLRSPLTGLVVLGSNGEAAQLDDDEADRVVAVVRESVPRGRPLIAGTGRESTKATIAASRRAAAEGVDAVIVRTPSFYKPQMTTEAFVRHYTEVADASAVPVLLYNVTLYTGVNLHPDAVERLASHPNIVGMKESGSDVGQIAEFVNRTFRLKPEATGTGFSVLAGSATTLFYSLCAGCAGAVLAIAALLPEECVRMQKLVADGRLEEARDIQHRIMPLARSVGGTYGVPGLKAALDLVGLAGGDPRPPLRPVSPQTQEIIRGQLEALGLGLTRA